jgi:hypothetical protein
MISPCSAWNARTACSLRELEDRQLLGMVAQCRRPVEHTRALALGLLQQMRGVEVFRVERRILAHQHRARVGQRELALGDDVEPRVLVVGQRERARAARHHARAAAPHQIGRLAGPQLVPAPRRLAHHREGGVLVGLERLQRVGHEEKAHGARC